MATTTQQVPTIKFAVYYFFGCCAPTVGGAKLLASK